MRISGKHTPHDREVELFRSDISASLRRDSDPAITAAFLAFHRHTIGRGVRATRASLLGAGGWAFAALAVFGFGGGLMLASFSFNEEPQPSRIATSRPPEMIYTAPGQNDVAAERAVAVGAQVPQVAAARMAEAAVSADHEAVEQETENVNATSKTESLFAFADAPLPTETMNFTAASRLIATGLAQLPTSGDVYETGYDAVELPMVPEASPGAIVASGLALLIAATHLVRRRRVA